MKLDRDHQEALNEKAVLSDDLIALERNYDMLQNQNMQLDRIMQNLKDKFSGQEQNAKREIKELKKENKNLLNRISQNQEYNDKEGFVIAEAQTYLEQLEEEKNNLLLELEGEFGRSQELSTLVEQLTSEVNQLQKKNTYLELANQSHQKQKRRLESRILELQQEAQNIKKKESTYSRINGIGESSGVSCSAYDSNRNFHYPQPNDVSAISPMQAEPNSHLNLAQ